MRKFLQNATIAVISSLCTFCLCIYFLQSDAEAEVSSAAQLVSRQSPSPVNASPRDWSAMLGFPDFSDVAKRVTDPVVSITTYGTTGYRVSSGSGVTVSADGHIMTNYHVVEEVQTFEVVLADNRTLPARLVGYDKNTDLAVLRVEDGGLTSLALADEGTPIRLSGLFSDDRVTRRRTLKRLACKLPIRPQLRLVHALIANGGIFEGRAGWTHAQLMAIYERMIVVKTKQLRHARENEQKPML